MCCAKWNPVCRRQLRGTTANLKHIKEGLRRNCRHDVTSTFSKTKPIGGSADTGAGLDEDPHAPDKDGVSLVGPERQTSRAAAEETSGVELGGDTGWVGARGNS